MVHMVSGKDDLESQITAAGNKLIVIDFHASWCGPCKIIGPKFNALSAEKTNVVFLKVDVDEHEEIAEMYNIDVMPTFIFLKNGKKVDSFSGANEGKLNNIIAKHE